MPLIFTGIPENSPRYQEWVDKGRPPLTELGTAKQAGLEFPYMKLVKGLTQDHERKLAAHCKLHHIPVHYFDFTDEDLVAAYYEANPDEVPKTLKDQARMYARTMTPVGRPGRSTKSNIYTEADAETASASGMAVTMRGGAGREAHEQRAERGQEMSREISDRDAVYAQVFEETKAAHMASGKSEGQAAYHAKRKAKNAAKKAGE